MIEPVQPDGGSLIFKPSRTRYQLLQGAKGCPEAVPEITAYEGVVVTGSTEPAVAGEAVWWCVCVKGWSVGLGLRRQGG